MGEDRGLALLVANQLVQKFAGGTWWVELGSVGDPEKVPEAVLRALGVSEQPGGSIREQALASLTEEPVLLVFDNCEHVLEAAASLVAELLADVSLTVMATSREPLGIPGEVRWPVPALAVPGRGAALAELADIDSVQLFVERATRAYPRFVLTNANAEAAARICRRLEGIPLAIELAAARGNVRAIAELAAELEERVPLTAATARGVPARQSTLLACVDWSYRLLDDEERKALRCLAGFPGSFSADAFSSVMRRVSSSSRRPAAVTLSQLTEKSLLFVDPAAGSLPALETIRVFASDRAYEASELDAIFDAACGMACSVVSRTRRRRRKRRGARPGRNGVPQYKSGLGALDRAPFAPCRRNCRRSRGGLAPAKSLPRRSRPRRWRPRGRGRDRSSRLGVRRRGAGPGSPPEW